MSSNAGMTTRVNTSTLMLIGDDGVLLVAEGGRWALPVIGTRGHWHAETAVLNRAVAERFGVTATVLRVLTHTRDEVANRTSMTLAMHWRDGARPSGARAVTIEEAAELLPDGARASFDAWRAGDGPPWSQIGWFDEAAGWAQARIRERGRRVTGDAEQIKQWSIASIMRVPLEADDAWFKAVPPMFAHEGTLLELIGPSMPDALPRTVAIDRERGWTLMEAIPQQTLNGAGAAFSARSENALRLLARLQQAWIGREDDLFAAGCADRRPGTIAAGLRELLTRPRLREQLGEHTARLDAFADTVPERAAELMSCGIPPTLVHGDFHAGNVALDEARGGMVIFDWTDGCLSHPFFDLATFLPDEPVERAAQLHAYLDAWTGLASMAAIERAWELAEPLAFAHHAISYMRILDAVRQSEWEFSSDEFFWLRWLRAVVGAG